MPPPDGYSWLVNALSTGGPYAVIALLVYLWLSELRERREHMNARLADGKLVAAALHEAAEAQRDCAEALRGLIGRRR